MAMKAGINKGLTVWFDSFNGFSPVNCWFDVIGQRHILGPVLIMMNDSLDPALINKVCAILPDDAFNNGCMNDNNGQNGIWYASEGIWRGCIRDSLSVVNHGLDAMKNVFDASLTESNEFNSESIFLQHGLFYNGGYGRQFMMDMTFWVDMAQGLSFAFNASQTNRLTGIILDANRWMVWRNTWDFAATGREISRGGPSSNSFGVDTGLLLRLPTGRSAEMRSFVASLEGIDDSAITGDKFFSSVDFQVHKRKSYHASFKMCSNRITNTEAFSGENIKGYYLSFGVFELMRHGNEYGGLGAVWDWARLPGVTCPRGAPVPDVMSGTSDYGGNYGTTTFAGGVSDGRYGAAGWDLNWNGVAGRKAWFFFDDELVALGAGINSESIDTVATSINQCRLFGDVWAGYDNGSGSIVPQGLYAQINPKWVFHDSVGYIFPGQATVTLKNEAQSGSWSSINAPYSPAIISEGVFSLWQDHGVNPVNAAYQYIVLPGVDKDRVQSYSNNIPVLTISNTAAIQAVRHDRLGITGIVFYQAGEVVVRNGLSLKADNPCIVLLDESGEKYKVTVLDGSVHYYRTYTVLVDLIFADNATERLAFNFNNDEGNNIRAGITLTSAASVTGWSGIVKEASALSVDTQITIRPNPFNPAAHISYYLPKEEAVSLLLYNSQGKMVRELVGGVESAGKHTVQVNAGGLASGIYICELKSNAITKRLKLVLMR